MAALNGMKTCPACQKTKPVATEFYYARRGRGKADPSAPYCIVCSKMKSHEQKENKRRARLGLPPLEKLKMSEAPAVAPMGKTPPPALTPAEVANLGPLPRKARVLRQHGFIEDETGRNRQWRAGEILIDQHEIALLTSRGALLEPME